MNSPIYTIPVYLEMGQKRTFACAVDWPGWCRAGRDEAAALQNLSDYAPRYARVLHTANLDFYPPETPAAFAIVERLPGTATTDFGAPDAAPADDGVAVDEVTLLHYQGIMEAAWQALDTAVQAAAGKELSKGPRGGGRDLEKIMQHVLEADLAYLRQLAWKVTKVEGEPLAAAMARMRQEAQAALVAAARGELPTQGPRGGKIWTPRYYVRRAVWHTVDHAWEIEDRI